MCKVQQQWKKSFCLFCTGIGSVPYGEQACGSMHNSKKGRADKQNTLYLRFEQQIIPGHLSYGIQVRADVSRIPHSHCRKVFSWDKKGHFCLVTVRTALTDSKKIN